MLILARPGTNFQPSPFRAVTVTYAVAVDRFKCYLFSRLSEFLALLMTCKWTPQRDVATWTANVLFLD